MIVLLCFDCVRWFLLFVKSLCVQTSLSYYSPGTTHDVIVMQLEFKPFAVPHFSRILSIFFFGEIDSIMINKYIV